MTKTIKEIMKKNIATTKTIAVCRQLPYRWLRVLAGLYAAFYVATGFARFDIIGHRDIEMSIDPVNEGAMIQRHIAVVFTSASGCSNNNTSLRKPQKYRVGIAASDQGRGPGWPVLDGLSGAIITQVSYRQTAPASPENRYAALPLNGQWPAQDLILPASQRGETISGEFIVTFDRQALLQSEEASHDFYLVGVDSDPEQTTADSCTSDGYSHDTWKLSVSRPRQLKISQLRDVHLDTRDAATTRANGQIYSAPMNFCVFASQGSGYRLKLEGRHPLASAEPFRLRQGDRFIPYTPSFRANDRPWIDITSNQYLGSYRGHNALDCNGGSNASLIFRVNSHSLSASGLYQDTLTISVVPE